MRLVTSLIASSSCYATNLSFDELFSSSGKIIVAQCILAVELISGCSRNTDKTARVRVINRPKKTSPPLATWVKVACPTGRPALNGKCCQIIAKELLIDFVEEVLHLMRS